MNLFAVPLDRTAMHPIELGDLRGILIDGRKLDELSGSSHRSFCRVGVPFF